MWATSQAFNDALASTARSWRSRLQVYYGAEFATELDIIDGSVSIDDVAVRRALNVTVADLSGTLTPATAADLLSPKGTELRPARGLVLPSGSVEWVPLGVFVITEPRPGRRQISLRGADRVSTVKARRFTAPWAISAGTPTTQAIVNIVTSRLAVETRVVATGHTTPEVVYEELSDPWDAVVELATADNLRAYFDALGTLVVEPNIAVETGVVHAAGEVSMLVSANRMMSAEKTYSGVIVTGEHPDHPPVRSQLWDTNPASPTYADGPFGRRPYGFASPLLTTQAQADLAAATILARVTGMYEEVELSTVGHIGHDVGDIVTIQDPLSRTHGRFVVVRASVPLRPGEIRMTLRRAP